MSFEDFKNHARLYVLGALYPNELNEFEQAKRELGPRATAWIEECCALRDAFALSLRPKKSAKVLAQRLMSMVQSKARRIA